MYDGRANKGIFISRWCLEVCIVLLEIIVIYPLVVGTRVLAIR